VPFSPFQKPSARRDALALQIQSAGGADDSRLLSVLQGQWVHRYGVASLPVPAIAFATAPDQAMVIAQDDDQEQASDREPIGMRETVADTEESLFPALKGLLGDALSDEFNLKPDSTLQDDPEPLPAAACETASEQAKDVAEDDAQEQASDRELIGMQEMAADTERSLFPASTGLLRDALSDELHQKREKPRKPVPAPPLNTPRSLRRWLPDIDESFPKAS